MICGRVGATRTTSTGLRMAVASGGEPAQPLKCTHTSQCECSCERSASPCAEYTAEQAISKQAATRASRRLRRKPMLKSGHSAAAGTCRVAASGEAGNLLLLMHNGRH